MENKYYYFSCYDIVNGDENEVEFEKFCEESKVNKNIIITEDDDVITRNIDTILGLKAEKNSFNQFAKCFDGGEYYELPYGSCGIGQVPINKCISLLISRIEQNDEYIVNKINECFDLESDIDETLSQLIKEQMEILIGNIISELNITIKKINEGNFKWK